MRHHLRNLSFELITKKKVKDLQEMIQQFVVAQKFRTVKATRLNPFSSRGHCIMRFYLDVEFKPKQGEKKGESYSSMFNFADLAGSEVHQYSRKIECQTEAFFCCC